MTDLVPLVPVTASLKNPATGAAAGSGTVTFQMSTTVVDSAGDELGPKSIVATVVNGEFSATTKIPATDTSTNVPPTFSYTIIVNTDVWLTQFTCPVPFSAGAARTLGQLYNTRTS